ncbi:hypothetical protein INT47_008756 [Mucor saturninus]|uniref:PH domain-containing protein n=1 Tax=Mucor saturninus TaxID=64648 RepID=A0A8H7VEL5_9FUNG|nr:hypothetical protein INT47_008756 [Mucor saturninus]
MEQDDRRSSGDTKQAKRPTPLYGLSQGSSSSATKPDLYSPKLPTSPTPSPLLTARSSHDMPKPKATVSANDHYQAIRSNSPLPKVPRHLEQHYENPTVISTKYNTLNRADIIIKRYESWNRFVLLLYSWINEMAKVSSQSERSYKAILENDKFSNLKGNSAKSVSGIHATMHGFTADLASQEHKFGRQLQAEHLPILENFKKECQTNIKILKGRQDLAIDEFLKRAEITASLISQLSKTCKEARRTIEKGSQVINDPWLVNLYLLRQLKKEVDEENRLTKLMMPIQQAMQDFESRLLKSVESTLQVCFSKPGALNQDQISSVQYSLNQVITNNWGEFVAMNKKDLVNEQQPLKHHLHINYKCKNDPLVMTVYKGQLERRSGVLNKYSAKFVILTTSGFLHQFKPNDKVSPEQSLYLPKAMVSQLKDGDNNTFEIQRSGSVLQRDKSYVFRAVNSEEMEIWCKLVSDVAASKPQSIQKISTVNLSNVSQRISHESTPPLSPISIHEHRKSISVNLDEGFSSKPKFYSAQLNID